MKIPEVIAEISSNHNGSKQNAMKLIKMAKKNGADYVKLQTYTPDTMTHKKTNYRIKHGLWKKYKLWDLYNSAKTPYSWHKDLFKLAKKIKIKCFSTPFDEDAVEFLEDLNCPIYKVASFEMNDLNLVEKIAKTKKPMIISTGMASIKEISETYNTALKFNKRSNITLLYCVSNYPAKVEDFNLVNIKILKKKFDCKIGLSDHSKDNSVALAAYYLGAEIFEKHFALPRQRKSPDIKFSLKGDELKEYKQQLINAHKLYGKRNFERSYEEQQNKKFRRSVYALKEIKKGDLFSKKKYQKFKTSNGT